MAGSQLPRCRQNYASQPKVVEGVSGLVKLTRKARIGFLVPGDRGTGRCDVKAWISNNRLRPNLLIGNDWLVPHGAVIDYKASRILLSSYDGLTFPFTALAIPTTKVVRRVRAAIRTTIAPQSTAYVPVNYVDLPGNDSDGLHRDYVFYAATEAAMNHILRADTPKVVCEAGRGGGEREMGEHGGVDPPRSRGIRFLAFNPNPTSSDVYTCRL
jgi:hypothetical protein